MNAQVQSLFFEGHRERRKKRDIALVEASDEHREKLDKCLDIIVCHHPDTWSHGTGILLIAPVNRGHTDSQKRAMNLRLDSKNVHSYRRYYIQYEDDNIGFFIRKTIEYRDRMRNFLCDLEIEGSSFATERQDIFDYVENNILPEFESLSLQAELPRRKGIRLYGVEFDYYRSISKNFDDYQILEQIEDFSTSDRICNPLRSVLLNIFPNILDNEPVARELAFEYDGEDLYVEFYIENNNEQIFPNNLPDLVNSTGECLVCYTEGDVLEWPCHSSHTFCKKCTDQICLRNALCPFCRKHILFSD
jgi:hypothetical protein